MRHGAIDPNRCVGDSDAAMRLLAPALRHASEEKLGVVFLDERRLLLRCAIFGEGTRLAVALPMRRLFREALEIDARAIVVAHNHPGGAASPSQADIAVTRRLVSIARALDLTVVDHLIFAGGAVASFRALGLL